MILSNAPVAGISMLFTLLSFIFILLVVLSGSSLSPPLNDMYFLQADTYFITGARAITRWTYFRICDDHNVNCGNSVPALPFGYAWSPRPIFAPSELIGPEAGGTTSTYYYYMWRFGWVFYLISLIFNIVALLSGFLACFGRLGAAVSCLITLTTLVFYTIAVSLMSATFVNARNVFLSYNRNAHIGTNAFGFSWGAWVCLIIATGLLFVGMRRDKSTGFSARGLRSKRGKRSHGSKSPASSEGGKRRVKEEYA